MTGDLRAEKCKGIFMGKTALLPELVMDHHLCAGRNACLLSELSNRECSQLRKGIKSERTLPKGCGASSSWWDFKGKWGKYIGEAWNKEKKIKVRECELKKETWCILEYLVITATAGTEGTSMAFLRKPNEGSGSKTTSEKFDGRALYA